MTHDEMIAVIEHHKKGGRLEMRIKYDSIDGRPGEWKDAQPVYIKWDFDTFDYRIKKGPVERWAVETDRGYLIFYDSHANALNTLNALGDAVRMFKMREVEDDS